MQVDSWSHNVCFSGQYSEKITLEQARTKVEEGSLVQRCPEVTPLLQHQAKQVSSRQPPPKVPHSSATCQAVGFSSSRPLTICLAVAVGHFLAATSLALLVSLQRPRTLPTRLPNQQRQRTTNHSGCFRLTLPLIVACLVARLSSQVMQVIKMHLARQNRLLRHRLANQINSLGIRRR